MMDCLNTLPFLNGGAAVYSFLQVPHRAVKGDLAVDAALGRREFFGDVIHQLDADAGSVGHHQEAVV